MFVYFLVHKELSARSRSDGNAAIEYLKKQEHFIERFLAEWSSEFVEKIKEHTRSGFYEELGGCLQHFIPDDLRSLNTYLRTIS